MLRENLVIYGSSTLICINQAGGNLLYMRLPPAVTDKNNIISLPNLLHNNLWLR